MDTSMSTQDEGRIDPDNVPENRHGNAKTVTDIDTLNRLAKARAMLIERGVDISEADDAHEYVGGISEFVRLEEERAALIEQGVDPEELEMSIRPMDTACLTGDESQFKYCDETGKLQRLEPVTEVVTDFAEPNYGDTMPGSSPFSPERVAQSRQDLAEGKYVTLPTTKDTNPKDGVGSLKPGYSNVPVPVLYEIGAALLEGERKYGGYNWRVAGVRTSVYINATRRHIDDFWEGQDIDPDSGLSHITKAIASLVVFRDAQIQNMVANDDRPPSSTPFMEDARARTADIIARYPNPKPNFTQAEVAHMRNTAVDVYAGQILGFELEVMLPAPDAPEGFVWMQQGGRRTDLDHTLAVAQALRDDGYGQRVIRITRVSDRVELMNDGNEYVAGEMRVPVETVFPGDWSLTEAPVTEDLQELEAQEDARRAEAAGIEYDGDGNILPPTTEEDEPGMTPEELEDGNLTTEGGPI